MGAIVVLTGDAFASAVIVALRHNVSRRGNDFIDLVNEGAVGRKSRGATQHCGTGDVGAVVVVQVAGDALPDDLDAAFANWVAVDGAHH